ncbi:hypothetical protein [Nostoc sp.]
MIYFLVFSDQRVGVARTSLRDPSLRDAARTASSGHRAARSFHEVVRQATSAALGTSQ